MNEALIETHPFEPYIPKKAKMLILGTFPPKPDRWSMKFFYPNKINDMWRIMGLLFYEDKNKFWNEGQKCFLLREIKLFLNKYGIALYDTGYKIRRLKDNASDKFLEIVVPTDIKGILSNYPTITAVVTAGEKATDTLSQMFRSARPEMGKYESFLFENRMINHYRAPSSSRAYPLSLEKKALAYARIFMAEGYDISEKNM